MTAAEPGLGRRMTVGGAWMVLARWGVRGIGMVSTIILARLLVPEDFGLIALAMSVVAALEALSQFGFGAILIRNQHATRSDYDTAWTLSLIKQLVIAAILALGAPYFAGFYGDPRVATILYIVAAASAAEGLYNIGVVDLQKQLQFARQFWLQLLPKVGSFVVTVALAIAWRNYWALLAGALSAKGINLILSYLLHPYRPRISFVGWRELLGFSKWLLLNNAVVFVNLQIDTILIGRMLGAKAVGLFGVAKEVALLPTTDFIWPLLQVTLPGFAKLGNNRHALSSAYLETLGVIFLLGAPMGIGVALVADLVVELLLGPNWLAAIPLMQALAVSGAIRVLYATGGHVFLIIGKPYLIALTGVAGLLVLAPMLYFGIQIFGLMGAAYATLASTILGVPIACGAVLVLLRISIFQVLAVLWRPFCACAAMAAAVLLLRSVWPAGSASAGQIALLIASVASGGIVYVAVGLGLWLLCKRPPGAEQRLLNVAQLRTRPA